MLKNERYISISGRQAIHSPAIDEDLSTREIFQSSNEPKKRRFAAPGRTQEDAKLAVGDIERDVLQDLCQAEGLGDTIDAERCDVLLPLIKLRLSVYATAELSANRLGR
jgi:hypothetical protein